jgi:heptose-I-phosphate ethanolaminephosphotransferase
MLMLVGETDSREVGDFLSSLVSPDLLFSRVGWILLLAVVNIVVSWEPYIIKKVKGVALDSYLKVRCQIMDFFEHYHTYLSIACVAILIWGAISSVPNKIGCWKLMTGRTIGEVEHTLT